METLQQGTFRAFVCLEASGDVWCVALREGPLLLIPVLWNIVFKGMCRLLRNSSTLTEHLHFLCFTINLFNISQAKLLSGGQTFLGQTVVFCATQKQCKKLKNVPAFLNSHRQSLLGFDQQQVFCTLQSFFLLLAIVSLEIELIITFSPLWLILKLIKSLTNHPGVASAFSRGNQWSWLTHPSSICRCTVVQSIRKMLFLCRVAGR